MKSTPRRLAVFAALVSFGLSAQIFADTIQGTSLYSNSVQWWDSDMWGTSAGVIVPGLRPTASDTVNFANSSTLSYQRTRVRLRTNETIENMTLTAKTLQLNLDQGYSFTITNSSGTGSMVFGTHTSNSATGSVLIANGSTLYVQNNVTLARSNSSMGTFAISGGTATIGNTLLMTGEASTQATLSITGGSLYVGSLNGNTAAANTIQLGGGRLVVATSSGLGFVNTGSSLRFSGDNTTGGVFFFNSGTAYTQSSGANSVFKINGTAQSIDTEAQSFTGDYDYLYFSDQTNGSVYLDGLVSLDFGEGFDYQVGDTFNLVYAGSITLAESLQFLVPIGPGALFSFDVVDNAETDGQIFQVSVIPEPSLAAVLTALAAIAVARRRRVG